MTKRRRAPLSVGGSEDNGTEDEEDDRPRPAPNTTFLGRLVRGVATGNQRQIDTTTSNAANLSIGATGAASLRLQLQRAASARTARYQTLRRVVLSSAEKQRLTLCTALLAEVAQGFGFRLTVRQPDGQEVGVREAIEAAERSDCRQGKGALDGGGLAGNAEQEEGTSAAERGAACAGEEVAGNGGEVPSAEGCGGRGSEHGLETLQPLSVELHLDYDGKGVLLTMLQQPQSPAGRQLASRLARSPSGARRPGANALLSGRLTSATLGSMGLMGVKKTAAAQAVQTARRRALLRATSNAGAEEAGAAAAAAARDAAEQDVAAAASAEGAATTAVGSLAADANVVGDGAGAKPADSNATSARRIVWDPDKLSRPASAVAASPAPGGGDAAAAASSKHDGMSARRMRATPLPSACKELVEGEGLQGGGAWHGTAGRDGQKQAGQGGGAKPGGAGSAEAPDVRNDGSTDCGAGQGAAAATCYGGGKGPGSPGRDAGKTNDGVLTNAAASAARHERAAHSDTALPAAGRVPGRPRAPIVTASASPNASAGVTAPNQAPEGMGARPGGGNELEESEPTARVAGVGSVPRSTGRPSAGAAGNRAGGMVAKGNSAGKLFGAAVRQLQRRSHG